MASFGDAPAGDAAKGAKIFKTKCAQVRAAGPPADAGLQGPPPRLTLP